MIKAANIKIIECPRDAMQGLHDFIPTQIKINYINTLLKVGFDTIDFGSFVSPKVIPQLRDTAEVLNGLQPSPTKLLAIVANVRGAQDAVLYSRINYIGFPFSVSETFQMSNTNTTIAQSFENVKVIYNLCKQNSKELVIYISMGFGNPYGDTWNAEIVSEWVDKIQSLGIKIISIADTVGIAKHDDVTYIFSSLIPKFKNVEFGVHLHCTPDNWQSKTEAAFASGCRRFDAAVKGFGGCPMAGNNLVGNLATEKLIQFLEEKKINLGLNKNAFAQCVMESGIVFNQ